MPGVRSATLTAPATVGRLWGMRRPVLPQVLQDRDMAKLAAGRLVSEVGSRITREGLPVAAIVAASASTAELGLLASLSMLPALVLGTGAGLLADRRRRRPLMIAGDSLRAVLLATVPAAALLGRLTFAQIAAVTTLVAAVTVVFQVADRAYVPSLAGRDRLAEANGVLSGADAVGESIGPMLMGVLVQTFGVPAAILADALSYVVSAISLGAIRRPEPPPQPETRAGSAGHAPALLDGLRVVAGHPVLRPLAGLVATTALFGGFFAALYEFYVLRTLHLTPAVLGLLITCGGVGSLVGAAASARSARRFGLGRTLVATFALSAVATALVPAAYGGFVVAFLFLFGAQFGGDLFATVFNIAAATLEQTVTPTAWLGRVEGALQTLSGGLGVVGALGAGILGAAIGPRDAFWIAACGNLAAAAWLLSPRLRRLDGPPNADSAWPVALGPAVGP